MMKVLDASAKPFFKKAVFFADTPSQLYHPTGKFGSDSQDIVYSSGVLGTTKFDPILLKEWGYLVKKNGYLVIDYYITQQCDAQKIEHMMSWLWQSRFTIISHEKVAASDQKIKNIKELTDYISSSKRTMTSLVFKAGSNDLLRCVFKKESPTKKENDTIDKWTFGIITNGKRLDWMDKIIKSIREQKIPEYEIIICGTYSEKKVKDITYIPFNQRDDLGWITKKKNIIISHANYENICLLHDRLVLDKNWYKGMKKWGNTFDILGCEQVYKDERVNDWIAQHNFIYKDGKEYFSLASSAEYSDWYKSSWLLGQLYILKKYIGIAFDENVYYGQSEDYLFSKEHQAKGYLIRFNPHARVITLTHKYLRPSWISFNQTSSTPKMRVDSITSVIKYFTFFWLRALTWFHFYPSQKQIAFLSGAIYRLLLSFTPHKKMDSQESAQVSG